jgi:hypothetical protein
VGKRIKRTKYRPGQRFGRLVLISLHGRTASRKILWRCRCDCGNEIITQIDNVRGGNTSSCGCTRLHDVAGQRFGPLLVMRLVKRGKHTSWECQCDCGARTIVRGDCLRLRDVKGSCGCATRRHGGSQSPTYQSWLAMRERCYRRKNVNFRNYGGRGIQVCARWFVFENFLADIGERPPGTTLDRINPNGHYMPSNCRWATSLEQGLNKRRTIRPIVKPTWQAVRQKSHGHTAENQQSSSYHSWRAMLKRCHDRNNPWFTHYGGRGVQVWPPWMHFVKFRAVMGERPPGMTLDRIDPNGHYEPSNCRWATPKQQSANRNCSRQKE